MTQVQSIHLIIIMTSVQTMSHHDVITDRLHSDGALTNNRSSTDQKAIYKPSRFDWGVCVCSVQNCGQKHASMADATSQEVPHKAN